MDKIITIGINMDIRIVHYKPGDYDKLIYIWEGSGLPYKEKGRDSRSGIEAEIKLKCNQFLFAEYNDTYIGAILVTHDGRKGWINRVAVLKKYRRYGIARKLIEYAEKWLDEQGIGIYACLVEDYNKDSFKVFQKLGYIPFDGIQYLTKRKFPEI